MTWCWLTEDPDLFNRRGAKDTSTLVSSSKYWTFNKKVWLSSDEGYEGMISVGFRWSLDEYVMVLYSFDDLFVAWKDVGVNPNSSKSSKETTLSRNQLQHIHKTIPFRNLTQPKTLIHLLNIIQKKGLL